MIDIVYDNVIALLGKDKESITENEKALIKFAIEDAENKIKNNFRCNTGPDATPRSIFSQF